MQLSKFKCILILLLTSSVISNAQFYSLSYGQSTYSPITGGTSVNNGLTWDEPEFVVPIGFDFHCMQHTNDELYFLDGSGSILTLDSADSEYILIAPLFNDIIDRGFDLATGLEGDPGSLSPITYKLEGSAGSRIFKLQWENVGFRAEYEVDSVASTSWNFQLWLYEGTDVVEFRFGPSDITSPSECFYGIPGPITGIFRADTVDFREMYMLENIPTAPTLKIGNTLTDITALTDTIPDGMFYRFTPVPDAVGEAVREHNVRLFPNPTQAVVKIANIDASDIESIEVWNLAGQKCLQLESDTQVDLSGQPVGVYMIRVQTADQTYTGMVARE